MTKRIIGTGVVPANAEEEAKSVRRIERLFLKYDFECIISIATTFIFLVISLFIINSDHNTKHLLPELIAFGTFHILINSGPSSIESIKTSIFTKLLSAVSLFVCIYIQASVHEVIIKDNTQYAIAIILLLSVILFSSILYRKYLYINHKKEANRIDRLFSKSIELFVLGLIILMISASSIFVTCIDSACEFIVVIAGILVSVIMLFVAVLNKQHFTKIFFTIYTSLFTPLVLFIIIHEFYIYENRIRGCVFYPTASILLCILCNIIVYRCYLILGKK